MKHYLMLFLLCCFALQADSALPEGYRKMAGQSGKQAFGIGFEYADKFDIRPARGVVPEDRVGRNGTRGLTIKRSDPAHYDIAVVPVPGLTPGKVYIITLWAKGENLKRDGAALNDNCGFFAVEFKRQGKYCGGEYGGGKLSADWQQISMRFSVPDDAKAELAFYLAKRLTGSVTVDDIVIREEGVPSSVLMLRPRTMTVHGTKAEFAFLPDAPGTTVTDLRLQVKIKHGKSTRDFLLNADNDGIFRCAFDGIEPGKVTVNAKLLDARRKLLIAEETFNCSARPKSTVPENACLLDQHGRAMVDGKPFMPIGIFGLSAKTEDFNYEQVRSAGFNSVMSYVPDGLLALDLAQKSGLKLIFSIAVGWKDGHRENTVRKNVEKFKNHPALLAWYVSDEVARADVPKVLKLREMVAAADPWHPAWTLTFRKEDLPYYGISGDIIGVDPYPITAYGDDQNIRQVADYVGNAATTGLPCWIVPQIFNWNAYHNCNAEAMRKTRFATAEEIMAMPLLAAIGGAKGFIFYSYFDLKKVDQVMPGAFEREWKKVCSMVAVLRELEPFIMSTKSREAVQVAARPDKSVHAGAFRAENGELRVIVVGLGGKTQGTLTFDDGGRELRSRYGLTRRVAPGKYEFTADRVNADILY